MDTLHKQLRESDAGIAELQTRLAAAEAHAQVYNYTTSCTPTL